MVKEGKVVEEIDGHTDVIYKKLRKDWHRGMARSRDLLISRYWRRTEDGRYGEPEKSALVSNIQGPIAVSRSERWNLLSGFSVSK